MVRTPSGPAAAPSENPTTTPAGMSTRPDAADPRRAARRLPAQPSAAASPAPADPVIDRPAVPAETPGCDLLEAAAGTFAMLAAESRIHLLWLLARGPRDVTSLARAIGATAAATSQHLAKLRLAGLVSADRAGKRQMYVVDDPHVVALITLALDHHADLRGRPLPR